MATEDARRDVGHDDAPLLAQDVSVRFGGVQALDGVSLRVQRGEIVGLIGGNGAGKTTLMDCVSGYVDPEPGGSLLVFGQEVVGLPPDVRPYLHMGRSYQGARLFPGLTVAETLLVTVERHNRSGVLPSILNLGSARRTERAKREQVDQLVTTMGLEGYRDTLINELSTGTRRVVDIAAILAQGPKLLLLDEPTAGLAQREAEAFRPMLRRVQDELGCSILLIEHDIMLVGELCDRVYALESGRIIAEGSPESVRADERVISSYLGTDQEAIRRSGVRSEGRAPPDGDGRSGALAGDPSELRELSVRELRRLAATHGIRGRSRLRKHELIDRLCAEAQGSAPGS